MEPGASPGSSGADDPRPACGRSDPRREQGSGRIARSPGSPSSHEAMTALLMLLGLAAMLVLTVVAWATLRHPLVPVTSVVLILPLGTHSLLGMSVAQAVSAAAVVAVAMMAVADRRSIIPRQPMLLWAS